MLLRGGGYFPLGLRIPAWEYRWNTAQAQPPVTLPRRAWERGETHCITTRSVGARWDRLHYHAGRGSGGARGMETRGSAAHHAGAHAPAWGRVFTTQASYSCVGAGPSLSGFVFQLVPTLRRGNAKLGKYN